MQFVARTLRWQRWLLAGLLVAGALIFSRATYDVFNTTKATVITLGAFATLAVGVVRVARTRRAVLPVTRVWLAVGAFLLAALVATLVSPTPLWSMVGHPGRHTGLAMYTVYAVLFGVALRLYRDHSPAHLAKALLAAAVPVSVYGLAQAAGIEPYGWNPVEGGPQVFATFGNANFFSAWLGIVTPLAVWGALTHTWAPGWRAGSGLLALLSVGACFASNSLQGVGAAVLGSTLVATVWLLTTGGRVGRLRVAGGGLAAVGLLAVGVGTGGGPFAAVRRGAAASLASRVPKWEVALAMFRDRPLTGFGLGDYAGWYHTYRPEAVAARDGLARAVDAPHSVPLDMLASGGLLLFVTYLAFVVLTGVALVRGLRRTGGEERLLFAAFGGAWVAYQAQALVSIDVPPLASLHWVIAGIIVAVGTRPPLREWVLPGAPALPAARPGRKRKAQPKTVPLAPAPPAVIGGLVVALLAGAWVTTLPLRADAAAMDGVRHSATGSTRGATDSYRRAADLAPWEPRYPSMLGGALNELGLEERAYEAYQEAVDRDPRGLTNVMNLARVAVSIDRHEEAAHWYARALELDPSTPIILVEVGRYWLAQGDVTDANALLERAVHLRGDQADWWVALGEARSADGDDEGAKEAFERALELNPAHEGAVQALERLA
ncbi:MAG TPA: O-antigen ligase family protein [Egibacteraceae bacterium]|jgi:O-antigen ligase/Flp pilus assembly protein TadD|nr:O-antigen ligase family protein [Egibacteraceae bacterium]